mmetsp:Transcript_39879/g.100492  ORF Transcript_39879/g.100492 Transcript_39879/m.100492 type:complete len:520 (-) Transcript_39879:41-1600(-)|eukprot:CAMPEP_0177645648 /NCGR_PEP_ID=MMETSP0447-20121125/9359_1 /TAXON_ID=0 /ORGANISM="Stygamoeba regulata, Strain BSH-02190019" /LENGTH=519 /DNA_ID=CAMNT_0019148141 /DNA_START=96 /DNA_END=1655 /DNA_ORIENTATION=+
MADTATLRKSDDDLCLLTDEEVRIFLTRGFLSFLPPSVSSDQHDQCYYSTLETLQRDGNMGNNVYPMMREVLDPIFQDPQVRGTLTSLLGPDYVMLPHRFCHWNAPGKTRAQRWHRDSYWGHKMAYRPNVPQYAMLMYYPQKVTRDMGPTAVRPETQYGIKLNAETDEKDDVFLDCEQGTVVINHYDIVHRATLNTSSKHRLMFKFLFRRTKAPVTPTWDCSSLDWKPTSSRVDHIAHGIWRWLCGTKPTEKVSPASLSAKPNPKVCRETKNKVLREELTIDAAYYSVLSGQTASVFTTLLRSRGGDSRLANTYALSVAALDTPYELGASFSSAADISYIAAHSSSPLRHRLLDDMLLPLFDRLFAAGTAAKLNKAQLSDLKLAQLWVVEAIGWCAAALPLAHKEPGASKKQLTRVAQDAVAALCRALETQGDSKEEAQIRFTAAFALLLCEELPETASSAGTQRLVAALADPQRYVRGNIVLLLQRLGQRSEAHATAVAEYLREHNGLCPLTTVASPF